MKMWKENIIWLSNNVEGPMRPIFSLEDFKSTLNIYLFD